MAEPHKAPVLIADRYSLEHVLGRGGMAVVYLAHDLHSQRPVALKRLSLENHEPDKRQHLTELFELEYYTLSQLSHPRVVEVYDFGRDDKGAFYTMELLDGGDLRGLSPIPWRTACGFLYDVCSVLSLLHSRRLIHRDLTPRNIRCTQDGKAKLIDFGAMQLTGPCKQVVGTPAFTAPEVVALQALDPRTDLYSMGATLYYVLTGRHAYSANSFNALRSAWRYKPRRPSSFVESIPKKLDALVLSLLELDSVARPMNAAEVMERLAAIASLEIDEQLMVSQSYLATPVLVGRDSQVLRVRKHLIRARRGNGRSLVVEGISGMGRSRFLDACILEGKLLGATIVRADASDAHSGAWGGVRAIGNQLLDAMPQDALRTAKPYLSVLGHVIPELISRANAIDSIKPISSLSVIVQDEVSPEASSNVMQTEGGEELSSSEARVKRNSWRPPARTGASEIPLETFDDPKQLRPRVQAALCDWLLAVSDHRCLMVAVDDFHRIDEPSAAFIALFANAISMRNVFVAVTTESDAATDTAASLNLLKQIGSSIVLKPLDLEQTHALLSSVFGEVSNVQLLADRLYKASQGAPSAIMKFAQHLLDRGLVRYQAGAWTLPSKFDSGDLPDSLASALKARCDNLSENALRLAQALSLSPEQTVSIDECVVLMDLSDKAKIIQALNELLTFEIVSTDGRHYALSQQGWVSVLNESLDPELGRILRLRMAAMLLKRGNQACRVAKHLFEAGEEERGLDVLITDAESDKKKIDQSSQAYSDFVLSLPKDWRAVYERALAVTLKLNRPKKQSFLLRVFLTRISDHAGLENTDHVMDVVKQLIKDSGLAAYEEIGDELDAQSRLFKALELTQQRFDQSPEAERVLAVQEAIPELAKTLSNVVGIAASSYDYALLAAMPSLEPLTPLSPALHIIDKAVKTTLNMFGGKLEKTMQGYREILARIAEPDRGGLDDTIHRYIDLGHRYGLGIIEASMGMSSSLEWAEQIEADPLHQVNAWRIRMVYYLRQGDVHQAEACKKKIEVLQIQNSPLQFYEGSHLYPELNAGVASEDLVRVKRVLDGLETMANRFEPWRPIYHFARGEYQRIRGDFQRALTEHETALSLMTPGRHLTWAHAAGAYIKTLYELNRFQEAKAYGEKSLVEAQRESLEAEANNIRMPLAVVQAKLDENDRAVANADTAIEIFRSLGSTGINPGNAYEARARVAVLMKDEEAFRINANLCAEQYKASRNPALTAKYERLMQHARQADIGLSDDLIHAADATQQSAQKMKTLISDMLSDCRGPEERAQRVIDLLVRQSNSCGGYLYTIQTSGPKLCALSGAYPPPDRMDTLVMDYLSGETDDRADVTMTCADLKTEPLSGFDWSLSQEKEYRMVLLGHNTDVGYAITGLAVLFIDPREPFRYPNESIVALSQSLYDSGDVSAILTTN